MRNFQLDHVVAWTADEAKRHIYENIVYSCGSCNWTKQERPLPDPCSVAFHGFYQFEPDGSVTPLDRAGNATLKSWGWMHRIWPTSGAGPSGLIAGWRS